MLAFTLSWFRLVSFGLSSVYISITNLYLNSLLVTFLGHAPLKGLIIIHLKDLHGMGSAHLNSIFSNVKHQPQINVNLFVSVCCLCQKRQCQDIPFPWIFWISTWNRSIKQPLMLEGVGKLHVNFVVRVPWSDTILLVVGCLSG